MSARRYRRGGNNHTPAQFPNHVLAGTDLELHAAMAGYWTRFAALGNPNDSGAVRWPAFTDPTGAGRGANKFLRLDAPIRDDKRLNETQCDFWESRFLRAMIGAAPAGG